MKESHLIKSLTMQVDYMAFTYHIHASDIQHNHKTTTVVPTDLSTISIIMIRRLVEMIQVYWLVMLHC
jgi:hypothetical protein